MLYAKAALGALLARAATASFFEDEALVHRYQPITLPPAVHPGVDRANRENLCAKQNTTFHFDSNPDPSQDSAIASLDIPGAPYPLLQLENSQYIQSVECSDNIAHIAFNDKQAFDAAVADWEKHAQWVMITYNPNCGSGYQNSKNDFALVEKVTPDNDTMIVDADIKFINYQDAIGNKTVVHATIGSYNAPTSKRWSVHKTLGLNWNEYPTNSLSDNQWGSGYQLLQSPKLDVICVGCGTKGDLSLEGEVDFSFFGGFDSAKISLTGSMQGSLAVGMEARGLSGSIPIASHQLAQIPIGGVEIPDIISIGPQIDISVGANLNLEATGSLLLGATLAWDSVDIELGLSGDNTQKGNGLTPTITPQDSASGSISATLDLHLPVSIGIGINILDGTWNKSLAIVDTPGFQLTGNKSNTAGSCSGVEMSADFYNNVDADILEITSIGLASFTTPFFSTCLFGSASSSATPTPSLSSPGAASPHPATTFTRTTTRRKSSPSPTPQPSEPATGSNAVSSSTLSTPKSVVTTQKATRASNTPTPTPHTRVVQKRRSAPRWL